MAYSAQQISEANEQARALGYRDFETFIEERLGRVNTVIGRPGDLTAKQREALRILKAASAGKGVTARPATDRQIDFIMDLQDQVAAHDATFERKTRAEVEALYTDDASKLIDSLKITLEAVKVLAEAE